MIAAVSALALAALLQAAGPAVPDSPHVHKTTLESQDYPGGGNHTVTVRTVVDPKNQVGRHIHPGLESAYVVDGQALLKVEGQPDRKLGLGDSFSVAPRTPHAVVNTGPGPLTMVSTYVVDPAQPIAQLPPGGGG